MSHSETQQVNQVAPYKSLATGIALGCLSLFFTYRLPPLVATDGNTAIRALKAIEFALIAPGILVTLAMGNFHAFRLEAAAAANFLFWFGFAWLVGFFITQLFKLRQAIAELKQQ